MSDVDESVLHALRLFGGLLKSWRGVHGWTQEEFAQRIGLSVETVSSIEQGRRPPRRSFFKNADEVLDAHGVIQAAEPYLANLAVRPVTNTELSEAEREAVCLNFFDSMTIPTLLHTEAYARAVVGAFTPALDEERLDLLVAAHLERRAVLERTPPARLSFVVDGSALRRPLGGWGVLGEQLAHLARIARRGNVTLQVLPLDCEDHAGLHGSITLVETAEFRQYAFFERAVGSGCVSIPKDISLLHQRYGVLRSQAMTTRDSLDLIEKLAAEYGTAAVEGQRPDPGGSDEA